MDFDKQLLSSRASLILRHLRVKQLLIMNNLQPKHAKVKNIKYIFRSRLLLSFIYCNGHDGLQP